MNDEATATESDPHSGSAFQAIRAINYTVIFVRDMAAMRSFPRSGCCCSASS
jgi:hypothetical protein